MRIPNEQSAAWNFRLAAWRQYFAELTRVTFIKDRQQIAPRPGGA